MIRLRKPCVALLCAFAAASAGADSFNGRIAHHNDILYHSIIVHETSDLVAWTNSYRDGENFDPLMTLWSYGGRLAENDDNPTIAPDQTAFDAGMRVSALGPGTYLFTIGAYRNFANGTTIGEGFRYDHETPIPLANWCQPASHCDMGPFVTLNWTLTPAVPEPATWLMLGAGLALTGAAVRRTRTRT